MLRGFRIQAEVELGGDGYQGEGTLRLNRPLGFGNDWMRGMIGVGCRSELGGGEEVDPELRPRPFLPLRNRNLGLLALAVVV